MPANTFAFAVFVGRQNKLANFLQRIFEFGDQFFSVRTDHIERIEVIFDVDAQSGPGLLFEFCRDSVPGACLQGAGLRQRQLYHCSCH